MQKKTTRRRQFPRPVMSAIAAAVAVLTWTCAGLAQVKPSERIELRPVASVDAQELVRINEDLRTLGPRLQRAIPRMPGPRQRVGFAAGPIAPASAPPAGPLVVVEPEGPPAETLGPIGGANFQALPDNNQGIPPDTHGTAGQDHLMTMLNTEVHIQAKDGTAVAGWPVLLGAFWAPTGATGFFDPRIIYDHASGEWIAIVLSGGDDPASSVHLAIHPGPNPAAGAWTFFNIPADPGGADDAWADFPDVGCNEKWIAITVNMFEISRCMGGNNHGLPCHGDDDECPGSGAACAPGFFQGVKMWVIERPVPLGGPPGGAPAGLHIFGSAFDSIGFFKGFTIRPCLTFGASASLYLVDTGNGAFDVATDRQLLRLSQIDGAVGAPVWSSTPGSAYGATGFFVVPAAGDFSHVQVGAPQSGGGANGLIDTGDARMQNAVFRSDRVWCTHSGGLPADPDPANLTRTAVFWYELDPAAMPNPIVQSGAIDGGDGVHHFYPSISANARDDALIGFSRCDAGIFAEAVFTGRKASDPAGAVNAISVLKGGKDTYLKDFGTGIIRWGDYSATVVDPADDLTFWTIQEYAEDDVGPLPGDDRWGTWWGAATLFPPSHGKLVYDNFRPLDDFGQPASQKAVDVPFFAEAADDFVLPGEDNGVYVLDQVRFATAGAPPVFWDGVKLTVYLDGQSCDVPGPLGKGPAGEPLQDGSRVHISYCISPPGIACELKIPMDKVYFQDLPGITCKGPAYDVRVFDLKPFDCTLQKNQKYWIAIAPEVPLVPFGQTYLLLSVNEVDHPAQQFFPAAGIPIWTKIAGNSGVCPGSPPPGLVQDLALQISANKEEIGPPCPWDCAVGDGLVGVTDFLALLAQWGSVGTSCDFDGSGVGTIDFLALLQHWGACP